MKKLRFPVIRKDVPKSKTLSMDDYAKFVELNIKYTLDRKADRELRKLRAVRQPFLIK
ncbi:hypothetical protein KKH26_03515 [Patescibacteria group bacterium]|nr:hypothetical protein [Patescibacteria group bacterium]MBU4343102.1 hypothetical protein [Candidatus Omnitrophota bacterium]